MQLHTIVRQTIKQYKEESQVAASAGVTIESMIARTVASRKRKTEEEVEDAADDVDDEDENDASFLGGNFRRGQLCFNQWSRKTLNAALAAMDKTCMDKTVLKCLGNEAKKEALEFALEVRVFGDAVDRVGQAVRRDQFEAMKKVYVFLGSRFKHLEVDVEKGTIDWSACAPIKLKSTLADKIEVSVAGYLLGTDSERVFPIANEQFLGDVGPFSLSFPFSLKACCLVSSSSGESYVLSAMFPGMKKRLGRRVSAEEGCINAMRKTAGQATQESKSKRAKAKSLSGSMNLGYKTKSKGAPPTQLKSPPNKLAPQASLASGSEGGAMAAKVTSAKDTVVVKSDPADLADAEHETPSSPEKDA